MFSKFSRSSHEQAISFLKAVQNKKTLKISEKGLSVGIEDVMEKMKALRNKFPVKK